MTHLDDIDVGDWIVVVAHKCHDCEGGHAAFCGEPHEVLAQALPFLLLGMNDREGPSAVGLDVREWDVQKICGPEPSDYVKKWVQLNCPWLFEEDDAARMAPSPSGHLHCLRCGAVMCQERSRVGKPRRTEWRWRCPNPRCRYDHGPVSVPASPAKPRRK